MTYCYSLLCFLWLSVSGSTSSNIERMPHNYSNPSINDLTPINNDLITMNFAHINTNKQWHAAFDARRQKLRWRLEQAENAEWNWPSTRARVLINQIENELNQLDADEFVMPNFESDNSCALEGACL